MSSTGVQTIRFCISGFNCVSDRWFLKGYTHEPEDLSNAYAHEYKIIVFKAKEGRNEG